MKQVLGFILLTALVFMRIQCAYMPEPPQPRLNPAKVLILYDATYIGDEDGDGMQDSLQLAKFYASARNIPEANLFAVTVTSDNGYINYGDAKSQILAPLTQHLDSIGSTSIDVFAVLWPLPIKVKDDTYGTNRNDISLDTLLVSPYDFLSGASAIQSSYGVPNPYGYKNPTFGLEPPRFDHSNPGFDKMYMVSRIDGPGGITQKMNMISNAIYADKYINTDAYFGTAYIDSQNMANTVDLSYYASLTTVRYGASSVQADVDANIIYATSYFKDRNLTYQLEDTGNLLGASGSSFVDGSAATSAPRAMFYWGWYSYGVYYKVYEWLPGSYASDLNSVNFDYGFRSNYYSVFGTQSLYYGATTAVGCINEPYTEGHPRIYVPPYMILRGYSWGEAALASLGYLGWNSVLFGDPLYQPFSDKELLVDNEAPQPGPIDIVFNNVTGVLCVFSLQGVESAKLTLRYGIISVEENFVQSRHFQTYFRQPFGELRGRTTYKYRVELEDPVGNKWTSEVNTFTTRDQSPYFGSPQVLPGEVPFYSFDFGGEGVASHDLVGSGTGQASRTDTGMQVTNYGDNLIYNTYFGEYIKWTVHANTTGLYTLHVKAATNNENTNGAFILYVDGVRVMDQFQVVPINQIFLPVANFTMGEGDHVIKIEFSQIKNLVPYESPTDCGQFQRLMFTLVEELVDQADPQIAVISSSSDDANNIENLKFTDDITVAYIEVYINGDLAYTLHELNAEGEFTFYLDKLATYNTNITAYDSAGHSRSYYKLYKETPTPSGTITPEGSTITPSGTVITPGTKTTPSGAVVSSTIVVRCSLPLITALIAVLL